MTSALALSSWLTMRWAMARSVGLAMTVMALSRLSMNTRSWGMSALKICLTFSTSALDI